MGAKFTYRFYNDCDDRDIDKNISTTENFNLNYHFCLINFSH